MPINKNIAEILKVKMIKGCNSKVSNLKRNKEAKNKSDNKTIKNIILCKMECLWLDHPNILSWILRIYKIEIPKIRCQDLVKGRMSNSINPEKIIRRISKKVINLKILRDVLLV